MAGWQYQHDPNATYMGKLDQGYYVKLPDRDPADNQPSGFLENARGRIDLWITQAQISFSLGGSFAQSMRLRQYFPRNLTMAIWEIDGIVPNSFQLQRLGEFIRESHFDALDPHGLSSATTNLTKFQINAGNLGNLASLTNTERKLLNKDQQDYLQGNSLAVQGKGPHHQQAAQGFISSFKRGVERFVNAPTYTFEFSVMYSSGDLFYTQNWGDIYKSIQEPTAITHSMLGTRQANAASPPPNLASGN